VFQRRPTQTKKLRWRDVRYGGETLEVQGDRLRRQTHALRPYVCHRGRLAVDHPPSPPPATYRAHRHFSLQQQPLRVLLTCTFACCTMIIFSSRRADDTVERRVVELACPTLENWRGVLLRSTIILGRSTIPSASD